MVCATLSNSVLKNMLIIGGHMNAYIGKSENKSSLHNSPNRNGEYLANFSLKNRLVCLNTEFQKKKKKEGKSMNLHLPK